MELPHLRSLLFTPGSDERKLAKALASAADAVVCDLEDAVAPDGKEAARELVARLLRDEAGTAEPAHPHPKGRGVVPPPTPLSVTSNSSRVSDDSSRDRDASVPIRARSGPARLRWAAGARPTGPGRRPASS